MADLFDTAVSAAIAGTVDAQTIANWVVNELPRTLKDRPLSDLALTGPQLAKLLGLVASGEISNASAREVLTEMAENGGDPANIVERRNLRQLGDASGIEPIVESLMTEFADRVQQYRSGRKGLLGFFVGQVMSRTQGRANPQTVNELVLKHLGE
jgi:Asp-tRNA(Asn)/Glu-tRNA(Gln) amidotransferase B subunit